MLFIARRKIWRGAAHFWERGAMLRNAIGPPEKFPRGKMKGTLPLLMPFPSPLVSALSAPLFARGEKKGRRVLFLQLVWSNTRGQIMHRY